MNRVEHTHITYCAYTVFDCSTHLEKVRSREQKGAVQVLSPHSLEGAGCRKPIRDHFDPLSKFSSVVDHSAEIPQVDHIEHVANNTPSAPNVVEHIRPSKSPTSLGVVGHRSPSRLPSGKSVVGHIWIAREDFIQVVNYEIVNSLVWSPRTVVDHAFAFKWHRKSTKT